MAEVDDGGLGVDGEDDALHHPHVGINAAKVGGQDYCSGFHAGVIWCKPWGEFRPSKVIKLKLAESDAEYGDAQKDGCHNDGELEQCLLQSSPGPDARLGRAKEPGASLFDLEQDNQDDGDGNQDLADVQISAQRITSSYSP